MTNDGPNRFSDTLKDLDQALNDWEQIVVTEGEAKADAGPLHVQNRRPSKPPGASEALEHARTLLEKLRTQIEDFDR